MGGIEFGGGLCSGVRALMGSQGEALRATEESFLATPGEGTERIRKEERGDTTGTGDEGKVHVIGASRSGMTTRDPLGRNMFSDMFLPDVWAHRRGFRTNPVVTDTVAAGGNISRHFCNGVYNPPDTS